MKADPYSLRSKRKPEQDFVFADSENPGFEARLRLRRYGVMGATAFEERAGENYRRHVTGSGPVDDDGDIDRESKAFVPPTPLPPVGDQPVLLTYGTCRVVAAVELAQVQDERYTFVELASMCVSEEIAAQMIEASAWVMPREPGREKEEGNRSGGSTGRSPDTALSVTSSTPDPSRETQNSSGASTNGLEASAAS